jgi:hypothetical protein
MEGRQERAGQNVQHKVLILRDPGANLLLQPIHGDAHGVNLLLHVSLLGRRILRRGLRLHGSLRGGRGRLRLWPGRSPALRRRATRGGPGRRRRRVPRVSTHVHRGGRAAAPPAGPRAGGAPAAPRRRSAPRGHARRSRRLPGVTRRRRPGPVGGLLVGRRSVSVAVCRLPSSLHRWQFASDCGRERGRESKTLVRYKTGGAGNYDMSCVGGRLRAAILPAPLAICISL